MLHVSFYVYYCNNLEMLYVFLSMCMETFMWLHIFTYIDHLCLDIFVSIRHLVIVTCAFEAWYPVLVCITDRVIVILKQYPSVQLIFRRTKSLYFTEFLD